MRAVSNPQGKCLWLMCWRTDRCLAKGLHCQLPISKRKSRPTEALQQEPDHAPHVSTSATPPTKKTRVSQIANNIRQLPTKVVNIIRSSAAYVGTGVIGPIFTHLKQRIGTRLTPPLWIATHFLLKKRAVQLARHSTELLDAVWIDNPQMAQNAFSTFITDKLGYLEETLCERARKSLEEQSLIWKMSLQQMRETTSWMQPQLSQLAGPDAVWVDTCVLGDVSKYSNSAWDKLFRNTDELHEFMYSSEAPFRSPLCEVGLCALIGILEPEDEIALSQRYFWQLTGMMGCEENESSEITHYMCTVEFVANCRDKWGNELECHFSIQCCVQNCGALTSRSIRAVPTPPSLRELDRAVANPRPSYACTINTEKLFF